MKGQATNYSQSIELEQMDWGQPDPDSTPMVHRCYALRKKPLGELSNDELRLAIGQQIGFPFMLDLAFERLEADPLLDGGCYPGDVLASLIRAPNGAWADRPQLREKLAQHFEFAMNQSSEITESFRDILRLPSKGSGIS